MKIRNGFVSNSSSSSFIIEYQNNKRKLTEEQIEAIMHKLIEVQKLTDDKITFGNTFTISKVTENDIKSRKNYEEYFDDCEKTDFKKAKNKIIINSYEDNSIPYWIQEYLINELGAQRWHWG